MEKQEKPFYSLMPIESFMGILGIDDREEKLSRFCLVTATHTIEQYCKRRLLRKKHFERLEYSGDLLIPFREYPVVNVLAVYVIENGEWGGVDGDILETEFYRVIPDCGTDLDIPFAIEFSPALKRYKGLTAIKVIYWSGYKTGNVPPDLASACLELASWNMSRYQGRRIGLTGNVRGNGKDGEHFEMAMPENVQLLLEPYKRKLI